MKELKLEFSEAVNKYDLEVSTRRLEIYRIETEEELDTATVLVSIRVEASATLPGAIHTSVRRASDLPMTTLTHELARKLVKDSGPREVAQISVSVRKLGVATIYIRTSE